MWERRGLLGLADFAFEQDNGKRQSASADIPAHFPSKTFMQKLPTNSQFSELLSCFGLQHFQVARQSAI
jgi:hypothetical protein